MKTKSKELLSMLLRQRFDTLQMSWQYQQRADIIEAAKDFNPELAAEMEADNKF